jgi:hypothetical protein
MKSPLTPLIPLIPRIPLISLISLIPLIPLVLLALALLAGCAAPNPHWDQRFGSALTTTLAAQVRDPDAGLRARPADSLSGRAALRAQQRYEQTFTDHAGMEPTLLQGMAK